MILGAHSDTQPAGRHALLAGCVALSLLLHTALLLGWTTPTPHSLAAGTPPLAVVLSTRPAPAQKTSNPASTSTPAGAESPRRTPPDATAPSAELVSAPNPPADLSAAIASDVRVDAVAARLNLEVMRPFHSPPLAVRRGWQGTVLLGVRIGSDGAIESIHLAQSSGHALLDRAALGALAKVRRIDLDDDPLRAALDLQLPIIYRLEES